MDTGIENREFLGVGWRFPLQVTPGGRIAQARYEQRVEESILLILATAPGERPMLPDFGCGIHELLFAPNDSRSIALVVHLVRQALTKYEPRIDLLDVPELDRMVKTYPVEHASAADLAKTLSSVFINEDNDKGPRATRIVADTETNIIAVWAPAAQQMIIGSKIDELDLRAEARARRAGDRQVRAWCAGPRPPSRGRARRRNTGAR